LGSWEGEPGEEKRIEARRDGRAKGEGRKRKGEKAEERGVLP